MDETIVKLGDEKRYVWAAVDVATWEVLAVWVSQGRSGFEAQEFLEAAREACRNEPRILVDRAGWYRWACDRLGLEYVWETFGERNPVEQWFGLLKQRVKRFYRRWPANASLDRVNAWVRGFVALYHVEGRVPPS